MFGMPLDGPVNTFCENSSVVTNLTQPTSMLKKKHKLIAYHRIREAVADNIIHIGWVKSHKNLVDMINKPLVGTKLRSPVSLQQKRRMR